MNAATRLWAVRVALLCGALAVSACNWNDRDTYTLYRNSPPPLDTTMRIHVASFDATDGADYNRQNCEIAAKLFAQQSGVISAYWCEKGPFRP